MILFEILALVDIRLLFLVQMLLTVIGTSIDPIDVRFRRHAIVSEVPA